MEFVATQEAATRLGLSARQVRNLAAHGELTAIGRGLIDRRSLLRYQATHRGAVRRSWAEATAWGAIATLTGLPATWMGQTQRSRLKATLNRAGASELVVRTRNRAVVRHFHAHQSAEGFLRSEVVETGSNTAGLGLAAVAGRVDGYIDSDDLYRLVATYALTADLDGQITLRCTTFALDTVRELATAGHVLASFDLAESLDSRERAAGFETLEAALQQLHG